MIRPLPSSFRLAVSRAPGALAVATIDAVTHPAPLPVGEQLLVWDSGVAGSISAGCIDGDVVAIAQAVLADGHPRSRTYGPDGSILLATTCGGTLHVAVERLSLTGDPDSDLAMIARRAEQPRGPAGRDRGRLFLIGATTLADRVACLAAPLGYEVVVIDPRPAFATDVQVSSADRVICGWPQRALAEQELGPDDALVLLTHDERYAAATLDVALRAGLRYVGALGSRSTAAGHRRTLADLGVPVESIAELHSPVGLPIGASGTAEIAVSIVAELISGAERD